jgi:hypothetical protein
MGIDGFEFSSLPIRLVIAFEFKVPPYQIQVR